MSKLAAALEVEVAALFPLAQTPLPDPAQERRAPVLDGPFVWDPVKGEEVEARRVKSYRPWTNLFNQEAARWEVEIERHQNRAPLEVAGRKTKKPFDPHAAAEISAHALSLALALHEVLGDFREVLDLFLDTPLEEEVRREVGELLYAYKRLDEAAAATTELSRPTPEASIAEVQERAQDRQRALAAREEIRRLTEAIA